MDRYNAQCYHGIDSVCSSVQLKSASFRYIYERLVIAITGRCIYRQKKPSALCYTRAQWSWFCNRGLLLNNETMHNSIFIP